jgi:hypothetical protein
MQLVRSFLLLAAAGPMAGSPAHAQQPALADTIRTFAFRMGELLRDRRADAAIALYRRSPDLVHIENGEVIAIPVLLESMARFFSTARSNPVSIVGIPGVTILDSSNAVVYLVHRLGAAEGRPAHEGIWSGVLHRFPDGWKIVHSHSTDRVANAGGTTRPPG